ncbi:MAG: cyanophycin synthetase, partial [Planctomycetota bacterium]|nr:cyanophycin synthetase [Planctomycetota bacterium]
CLSTERTSFEHVNVPLPGEHQALNCGLALAIIDKLRDRGFEAPEIRVIEGLADTVLPGRMELAWPEPRILLDGAHNASSLKALMRSVGVHMPYDSLVVVFGCAEDKDVDELLRCVATGADKLIFTKARGVPRALDPRELQMRFMEISGKMTQIAETLPEALDLASRAVSRGDLICVTGSFYLVGEAKKHLLSLAGKQAAATA